MDVGLVGVAVGRGPDQVLQAELAPVHRLVVARGHHVAVEASWQVFVGNDVRRSPAVLFGLGLEEPDAKDVVDVAV